MLTSGSGLVEPHCDGHAVREGGKNFVRNRSALEDYQAVVERLYVLECLLDPLLSVISARVQEDAQGSAILGFPVLVEVEEAGQPAIGSLRGAVQVTNVTSTASGVESDLCLKQKCQFKKTSIPGFNGDCAMCVGRTCVFDESKLHLSLSSMRRSSMACSKAPSCGKSRFVPSLSSLSQ